MSVHVMVQVTDISSVGEARRALANLARSIEFSEGDTGRASIIISELATNIIRHALSMGMSPSRSATRASASRRNLIRRFLRISSKSIRPFKSNTGAADWACH